MWHLEKQFSIGLFSAEFIVGFDDLKGLLQLKGFYGIKHMCNAQFTVAHALMKLQNHCETTKKSMFCLFNHLISSSKTCFVRCILPEEQMGTCTRIILWS